MARKGEIDAKNWIGKSFGAHIDFHVEEVNDKITVFSTRPDTLFGASFIALSPEHKLVDKIGNNYPEIKKEIEKLDLKNTHEQNLDKIEKIGIETPLKASHPF